MMRRFTPLPRDAMAGGYEYVCNILAALHARIDLTASIKFHRLGT